MGVGDALIRFTSFVCQVESDSSLGSTMVIGFQELGVGGEASQHGTCGTGAGDLGPFTNGSFLVFSFVGEWYMRHYCCHCFPFTGWHSDLFTVTLILGFN